MVCGTELSEAKKIAAHPRASCFCPLGTDQPCATLLILLGFFESNGVQNRRTRLIPAFFASSRLVFSRNRRVSIHEHDRRKIAEFQKGEEEEKQQNNSFTTKVKPN